MAERDRTFTWKSLLPLTPRDLVATAMLVVIYAAVAAAGLRWAIAPGANSAFYPAAGVALAALAVFGVRLWPGVVMGKILAALVVGSTQPVWAIGLIAAGATLSAAIPVLAVEARGRKIELGTLRGMLWLVVAGAAGGALISALFGMAALAGMGLIRGEVLWGGLNWWFGDLTGVLAVAPLLMSWRRGEQPGFTARQWLHLTVALAAVGAVGWVIFVRTSDEPIRAWFAFPGLVWAALAFSVRGGSLAVAVTAGFALAAAALRTGTLSIDQTPLTQVLLTQQFVAIMAATTLFLAAATDERRQQEKLRLSEKRLRAETEALEVLNSTGAAVAAELDLDAAVHLVTEAGVSLCGAQFGAFFYNVIDERGEAYMLYALAGVPAEAFANFPHPRNTAVFAPTFGGEGVVRVDDITKDPRYGHNAPNKGMPKGHLPVRSYLASPVKSRSGEVIGGLFFGHAKVGVFDERAERLITGLASQAAIAIDNARLYQSAQRELEERRRAEERQRLLINELNHRVKNTLATVQSMGAQSLRSASSLEEAREAFVSRLIALSTAHNLLTAQRWEGAQLADIVDQALQPFLEGHDLDASGPDVWLESSRALGLAMALHELGTNAAKYGALSNEQGDVRVRWTVDGEEVRLTWEEHGGPPVAPPTRRGFGSRLIEQGLARELNGTVDLQFRPQGVRCDLHFRLAPEAAPAPHPLSMADLAQSAG